MAVPGARVDVRTVPRGYPREGAIQIAHRGAKVIIHPGTGVRNPVVMLTPTTIALVLVITAVLITVAYLAVDERA